MIPSKYKINETSVSIFHFTSVENAKLVYLFVLCGNSCIILNSIKIDFNIQQKL